MILLRPDCLVFKTAGGESIPCSAHDVTVELMGDSAELVDKEMILHAAEAVLHYFKTEKGQHTVSVAEFSEALERVLRGLGLDVKSAEDDENPSAGLTLETTTVTEADEPVASVRPRVVEEDLNRLASESDGSCELVFFPRLRDAIRRELDGEPLVLRFRGLRGCVKRLTGCKRWGPHCQSLNDQIVEFLRTCLTVENAGADCALVVW
jgi:hypothetical protein